MKIEIEKVYFILEQKIYEIEDEKVRYGRYAPLLEAQLDTVNEIMTELKETVKYNEKVKVAHDTVKKVPKRRGSKS